MSEDQHDRDPAGVYVVEDGLSGFSGQSTRAVGEPARDQDPVRNVDDSSPEQYAKKVDTFEEFSGYTTLHGIRFIGDRSSRLPRRTEPLTLFNTMSSYQHDRDPACIYIADDGLSGFSDGQSTRTFGEPARDQDPVRNVDDSSREQDAKKVDTFEEFSGYTTLHGIRFIGDRSSRLPRRCLWVLIVLGCTALFGAQVYDRFDLFMSSPVNVNFLVTYPDQMTFPAVTLCNVNQFRLSKVYEGDWLDLISYINDANEDNGTAPLSSETHLNASITELFEGLAHSKEDFIVKCQWASEECSAENFTTILTPQGVCFTFNKVARPQDSLVVNASGAEHALRLTLNTEAYERLRGSQQSTGIRMLLNDHNEIPRVEEGIALSTGVHAFVGVSVVTRNDLPPPYNDCGEQSLVSTELYSQYTCMLECETMYANNTCGCRHFYMPDLKGAMPVCSVNQYFTCLQGALKHFSNVSQTMCRCPSPCLYNIYQSTLSYATSAHMKSDVEDGTVNVTRFKTRLFAAKEILSAMEEDIHGTFNATLVSTTEKVQLMISELTNNWKDDIASQVDYQESIDKLVLWYLKYVEDLYDLKMFIVKNNFMGGRDKMEQDTFSFVCHDYLGFIHDVQDKLVNIAALSLDDASAAKVIYLMLMSSLTNKKDTVTRALVEYERLVDAYKYGDMLLNNTHPDYSWFDFTQAIPKHLLRSNETILEKQHIFNIVTLVKNIVAYVIDTFENSVNKTDDAQIKQLLTDFASSCNMFVANKKKFYYEFIDKPLRSLEEGVAVFHEWKTDYFNVEPIPSNVLTQLKSVFKDANDRVFPNLLGALSYLHGYLDGKTTKYDIASNNQLRLKLNEIETYFDNKDYLTKRYIDGWFVTDSKLWDFEDYIRRDGNIDDNTRDMLTERMQLDRNGINYAGLLFAFADRHRVTLALQSVDSLSNELGKYHADHSVDEEFYRRNFLQLDVYFKELRSEEITQQKGYDEIALLCDIGGATGLFIGGSVITVVEIVEFLLMCLVCKTCNKKAKVCRGKARTDE